MTRTDKWGIGVLFLFCALTVVTAPAQTFTSLLSFDTVEGPNGLLAQGLDGELYGATFVGGSNNNGTVFKITTVGQLTSFENTCTGAVCPFNPLGGLVLAASGGNFYGMTMYGGANGDDGTVFRITPDGKPKNLYSFCSQSNCEDGDGPLAGLAPGSDGNFYGTTGYGGTNCGLGSGCVGGTVFKITPTGKLTTLYSFCAKPNCADGQYPDAGLFQATDGDFYGTTSDGGTSNGCGGSGCGTIFKISPAGELTTLYSFCSQTNCRDGSLPSAGLVQGTDGNFYGTTLRGGTDCGLNGCGTVFKITPRGKLTTLHSFCPQVGCADGFLPNSGLVQATDGNFYGTTDLGGIPSCGGYGFGCGTIFMITPAGALTTLHVFDGTDGYEPNGLMQATNGNFYGSTAYGGTYSCPDGGCGTVYSLSMGLNPFVSLVRVSGRVGQMGGILGQGFAGTTAVSVNGTPASFTVVSDTSMQATIPAGATSGYVTVTTTGGTLTSNVPIRVIP